MRAGLFLLALVLGACAPSAAPSTVEVVMRYSHFTPTYIEVPRGTPVTIVLRNDDPIDHEWIVGTPELHERHRTGTEPTHGTIPTEVTVPALGTKTTIVTFGSAGSLSFVCHLPGHERYGMHGTLIVR